MRSCGCGYSCRCSSSSYFSAGGGEGWGWGVFLLPVYSSAFLIGADLYYFLSAILESSDFLSLFSCDYLSVCDYVGFAEVYLQFSQGCGRVPQSGGGTQPNLQNFLKMLVLKTDPR